VDETFAADVGALEASSADLNDEWLRRARDWLEREFPVGTTKPAEELRTAAKASGIPIAVFLQVARQLPSLRVDRAPDGTKLWTRAEDTKVRAHANGDVSAV